MARSLGALPSAVGPRRVFIYVAPSSGDVAGGLTETALRSPAVVNATAERLRWGLRLDRSYQEQQHQSRLGLEYPQP